MLSYLLANRSFRRDMLSDASDGGGDDDAASANDSSLSLKQAEYLAASIFFGMLLGGTLLGFLSDHIGRRPALLTGLGINATAGLFSSFSFLTPTIGQLTAWRFLAGIGIGATVPSLFSLASEWCPKEVRGAVVTLVASFWMVGSLFVSSLGWILFGHPLDDDDSEETNQVVPIWRLFAAFCAMPSAVGAIMVYLYVPESPRFLASTKQNHDTAACVCNQVAATLGIRLAPFEEEVEMSDVARTESYTANPIHTIQPLTGSELRHDDDDSIISSDSVRSISFSVRIRSTVDSLIGTLQRLYSPQLLTHTTLPLQTIWFSLSFSSYGITTWINSIFTAIHLENLYLNSFLFALANLPGNVISVMYADRWGRRRMLVGSLIGAAGGLALFAMLVFAGDNDSITKKRTWGIVLSACIFQMFSIISWNAVDIVTGEQFPTRVRSGGMGACTACGRFGAMFAQFVNAHLMMAGSGNGVSVLIVASSTLLLGALMPMLLDEMALGALKDETDVVFPTSRRPSSMPLNCRNGHKDHMSDTDEGEKDSTGLNDSFGSIDSKYQSVQQENYLL